MACTEAATPTHRQLEIIAMCGLGMTREEIGRELFLSPFTVKKTLEDLRRRLGARNNSHALSICFAEGYLGVDRESEGFVLVTALQGGVCTQLMTTWRPESTAAVAA